MLDRFLSMTVLAQATPAPPGGPAGPAGSVFTLLPFLLIGVLFYFLLVVPERRKARDLEQMIGSGRRDGFRRSFRLCWKERRNRLDPAGVGDREDLGRPVHWGRGSRCLTFGKRGNG